MSKLVRSKINEQFRKGKDPYEKWKIGIYERMKKKYNLEEKVRRLHSIPPQQEVPEKYMLNEALIEAVRHNNLKEVKHLFLSKNILSKSVNVIAPINIAAKNGYIDILDFILDYEQKPREVMFAAIEGNQVDVLKFLEEQTDITYDIEDFLYAIDKGSFEVLKYLYNKENFDLDARNGAPLKFAVRRGHLDMVKFLINNGANFMKYAQELIHDASVKNYNQLKEYLVKKHKEGLGIKESKIFRGPTDEEIYSKIDKIEDPSKMLIESAKIGYIEGARKALDNGANIHIGNSSPLRYAAYFGHFDMVKFLVESGAKVPTPNNWAQQWALQNGHKEIASYLKFIEETKDVNEQFEKGKDPFDKYKVGKKELLKRRYDTNNLDLILVDAIDAGDLEDVKIALAKGADIHFMEDTLLHRAAGKGYLDIVKYLFQQGANNQNIIDTALHVAAEKGQLDVVKYLVENGADIHDIRSLILASRAGNLDVIKYLDENGADIHAANDLPLREAAKYGHLDVVRYFHKQGADLGGAVGNAFQQAVENGHLDVVKYLYKNYDPNLYYTIIEREALETAAENGHQHVVNYVKDKMKEQGYE